MTERVHSLRLSSFAGAVHRLADDPRWVVFTTTRDTQTLQRRDRLLTIAWDIKKIFYSRI